eukprot:scaffold230724_cov18-Prasinocladus_malaysianus.AAC.1
MSLVLLVRQRSGAQQPTCHPQCWLPKYFAIVHGVCRIATINEDNSQPPTSDAAAAPVVPWYKHPVQPLKWLVQSPEPPSTSRLVPYVYT